MKYYESAIFDFIYSFTNLNFKETSRRIHFQRQTFRNKLFEFVFT
jgi:hypothetical protein